MCQQANTFVQGYEYEHQEEHDEEGDEEEGDYYTQFGAEANCNGLTPTPATAAAHDTRIAKPAGKRRGGGRGQGPKLQVRRTLRVKIKKNRPILGIAIEGGVNVSGQLLPRIVCVHVSSYILGRFALLVN